MLGLSMPVLYVYDNGDLVVAQEQMYSEVNSDVLYAVEPKLCRNSFDMDDLS